MENKTFRLNRKGNKIEFVCSNTWIVDKVEDYIYLIIDATNYRNTIHRVVEIGDEPLIKRGDDE